jgi:hypothetical protein
MRRLGGQAGGLTDAAWAKIEPLLPGNGRRGGSSATTGRSSTELSESTALARPEGRARPLQVLDDLE